jgi:hypothetical protein
MSFVKVYGRNRGWLVWGIIGLACLTSFAGMMGWWGGVALAQEEEPAVAADAVAPRAHLFVTGSDAVLAPLVQLRLYGVEVGGEPLAFSPTTLSILHNNTAVPPANISIAGQEEVGTFTIFLIDNPPGVQEQQEALQTAIQQYASPAYMREGVDYVAIYEVGARGTIELLPATPYYNSVTNLFIDPLPIQAGATALIDSIDQLLNQAENLSPKPELAIQMVVLSDGTDAVSTQTPAGLAANASTKGWPIHTILLLNTQLGNPNAGAGFMQGLARASNGLSTELADAGGVSQVWAQLVKFREQTLVRYQIPASALDVGQFPVVVALARDTAVQDSLTVSISAGRPIVTIDVPPNSRTLTLPSVDSPTQLSFPITVSWLSSENQQVTQAQLLLDGQPVANIPPAQLSQFTTAVPLRFGQNSIQVAVVDSNGQPGMGEISLTVSEGTPANIPAELQPTGWLATGNWLNWLLGCFFAFAALLALLFLLYTLREWPAVQRLGLDKWLAGLPRPRLRRAPRRATAVGDELRPTATSIPPKPNYAHGSYLEILDSVSPLVGPLPLTQSETRLGRAPGHTDHTFSQDPSVSRLHATLIQEGNSHRIFDEQSTSGTLVNGQPIPEYGTLLFDGDEIMLGAVVLRYRNVG